jgi:hypothetical protein
VSSQEVLGEEEFAGSPLESAQVYTPTLKRDATLSESTNLLDGHEEVTTLNANDRTHNGRMRVVAETRDQILDASNPVASLVKDWPAQEC